MELIEMLGNPQLLTLAIKYASKQNRRLAEKLTELANSFTSDNEDLNYSVSCTNNFFVLYYTYIFS